MIVLVLFAVLASSRAPSCSSLLSCAIVVESGARGVQQHLSAGLFLLVLLERLAILFTIQNVITHEFECVAVICVVLLLSVLSFDLLRGSRAPSRLLHDLFLWRSTRWQGLIERNK